MMIALMREEKHRKEMKENEIMISDNDNDDDDGEINEVKDSSICINIDCRHLPSRS